MHLFVIERQPGQHGLIHHPHQRDVTARVLLAVDGLPTAPDITMVAGEIHLLEVERRIVLRVRISREHLLGLVALNGPSSLGPRVVGEQHRLELDAALVDTDRVAGDGGARLARVAMRDIARELRDAVDGIEQAQELHPLDGPTHGLAAQSQLVVRLLSARMRLRRKLPVREGLPHKGDELLVVGADQTDIVEHLVQEARRVCAAREPEQVDLAAGFPAAREEAVAADDMFVERGGQSQVECFLGRQVLRWAQGEAGQRAGRDVRVGSYAGCSCQLSLPLLLDLETYAGSNSIGSP